MANKGRTTKNDRAMDVVDERRTRRMRIIVGIFFVGGLLLMAAVAIFPAS